MLDADVQDAVFHVRAVFHGSNKKEKISVLDLRAVLSGFIRDLLQRSIPNFGNDSTLPSYGSANNLSGLVESAMRI